MNFVFSLDFKMGRTKHLGFDGDRMQMNGSYVLLNRSSYSAPHISVTPFFSLSLSLAVSVFSDYQTSFSRIISTSQQRNGRAWRAPHTLDICFEKEFNLDCRVLRKLLSYVEYIR